MTKNIILKLILCFLFYELIAAKQIHTPNPVNFNSNKINECKRCKVLTDSFNHWMDKTSRGKYEGGDAAWEEAKLKSYSRSEIRLVEVQEGLCSEVKRHTDSCYALAEEAEQVLEKWWFHEDPDTVDLYTWLCIENLQYCCPSNHFGDLCTPCPLDKNSKICSGQGTCDGDGTRKGNGTCICKKGYDGKFCEECDVNYYRSDNLCFECDRACNGCSGEGKAACNTCNSGWELNSGVCEDINECSSSLICKDNQYCLNSEGSYSCKACHTSCKTCTGDQPTNCTSCSQNNVKWSGMCLDEKQKNEILSSTFHRATLYFGLSIITLFIFRKSSSLASIVVFILAVYVYFSEKSAKMHLIDVIFNLYS